jgi:hypothetical protein
MSAATKTLVAAGVIDVDTEELVPIREAPKHFRTPRKPCHQSVHRWSTRGVRGAVLGTVMVAGLRYTSVEAIRRFVTACNADNSKSSSTATIDAAAARRSAEAERALIAIGS